MKKNVLILLAVMLWGVPKAFAYDFSAVAPSGQTLYYKFIYDGSVCVTYPSDANPNYNSPYGNFTEPTGELTIPSTVNHNGSSYIVRYIDRYTFSGCSGLTSVMIPNSVTTIDA